jgi:hypothetical protein
LYENRRQGEGGGVAKTILEFLAGADHGIKAKTRRKVNSARHKEYEDRIKI